MPSSFLQVVKNLFQTCYNKLGTSSANTTCWQLVNRLVTTCLQTCNNLWVFTRVLHCISKLRLVISSSLFPGDDYKLAKKRKNRISNCDYIFRSFYCCVFYRNEQFLNNRCRQWRRLPMYHWSCTRTVHFRTQKSVSMAALLVAILLLYVGNYPWLY